MIPKTTVSGHVYDQTGQPFNDPVTFRLSQTVRDMEHGIITPSDIRVTPVDGFIEASLWPNSRGEKQTHYRMSVADDVLTLAVPDQPEADLVDLVTG